MTVAPSIPLGDEASLIIGHSGMYSRPIQERGSRDSSTAMLRKSLIQQLEGCDHTRRDYLRVTSQRLPRQADREAKSEGHGDQISETSVFVGGKFEKK